MEQTSIISPWIVYAIDFLTTFQMILIMLFALSLVSSMFCVFNFYCENDTCLISKNSPLYKPLRISSIVMLTSLILLMFIPKETTMYKMLIASEITYERADEVVKMIDNKADAIVEALR